MGDKSRIYLEQGIAELRELERKNVFTKQEIRSISKKRSEFEHRVNATRCEAADFVRYARYEINLETLRAARSHRLSVKCKPGSGFRRIRYILERGTRRFHGDVALWLQYVDFLRKEKSTKVLGSVLRTFLKLHPSRPELWVHAARVVLDDDNDISEARYFMQRGLELNRYSKLLWLEYAKLELVFLSMLSARKNILGVDGSPMLEQKSQDNSHSYAENDTEATSLNPTSLKENNASHTTSNTEAASAAATTTTTTDELHLGKIPISIFDTALLAIENDITFAVSFFDLFASFPNLPCQKTLLAHAVASFMRSWPAAAETLYCYAIEPIAELTPDHPNFPSAMMVTLSRFFDGLEKEKEASNHPKLPGMLLEFLAETLQSTSKSSSNNCLRLALTTTLSRILGKSDIVVDSTQVTKFSNLLQISEN